MKCFGLSARARGRLLKLARTIADLDGAETITDLHVSQAVTLRCLDRKAAPGAAELASSTAAPEHELTT